MGMTPCSYTQPLYRVARKPMYPYLIYCADLHVHAICLCYLCNPQLDIKTLSASHMCLQGIAKKNQRWQFKAVSPCIYKQLLNVDTNKCHDACHALGNTFPNTASCLKVVFNNKFAIYHSIHEKLLVWAKENSHFTVELEHNPPQIWCDFDRASSLHLVGILFPCITHHMWCMTLGHINGPHFFKGSASAISYAEMLEVWLIPQPRDGGLLDYVWPQNNSSHIFCFSV